MILEKILVFIFLMRKAHSWFSDGTETRVSETEHVANCSCPTYVSVRGLSYSTIILSFV